MAKLTPMQIVKNQFGSKEKLAAQLASGLIVPADTDKADFEYQLKCMSNSKLLRLLKRSEALKAEGGFEKLVETVTTLQGGNADRLAANKAKSIGQLLDMKRALAKKAKA